MSQAYILPENNSTKFDDCKHRSKEEITKVIKRCSCQGGDFETKGFFCFKRNIFKVEKGFCDSCNEFESK